MQYFTPEASARLLTKLLAFVPPTRCARLLGVSVPTFNRWIEDKRVPARQLLHFQDAFEGVKRDLERRAKRFPRPNFFDEALELMDKRQRYETETPAPTPARKQFVAEMQRMLRRPVDVREVMRCAKRHGVTRPLVYRIAADLGVRKRVLGVGRNMHSTWRLP